MNPQPRTKLCACKPNADGRRWVSAACPVHGVQSDADDLTGVEQQELLICTTDQKTDQNRNA